ncbi:hypothetical protein AGMMS49959_17110 [Planctomycetales bacterium]|nr:hypothetical protein AGMMS49959_17110 [Planctomycetales bacterium]
MLAATLENRLRRRQIRAAASVSDCAAASARVAKLCPYGYAHTPNAETLQAIKDAEAGIGLTAYASVEEWLKSCESEAE